MTGTYASVGREKHIFARDRISAFLKDESGSTAIEYGLIAALLFLAIVASIKTYSQSTSTMYNDISDAVVNG